MIEYNVLYDEVLQLRTTVGNLYAAVGIVGGLLVISWSCWLFNPSCKRPCRQDMHDDY